LRSKEYFYFAASLPMIQFEDAPPMTCEDFLADCERLLPAEDSKFLNMLLSLDVPHPGGFKKLMEEPTSTSIHNRYIKCFSHYISLKLFSTKTSGGPKCRLLFLLKAL